MGHHQEENHTSLLQLPRPWWLVPPGGHDSKHPSCQFTLLLSGTRLSLKVSRSKQAG